MKIITILLLMISTQALAEERVMVDKAQALLKTFAEGDPFRTVEQCNQIANISKRTIKAAIIGVPIAEVIEKFTHNLEFDISQVITNMPPSRLEDSNLENITIADSAHHSIAEADAITDDYYMGGRITAIYKTVDQIKTKYGQVRPQDRARLNNRVEQKLMECLKLIDVEAGTDSFTDYDGNDVK
jgi:hypothetical protein